MELMDNQSATPEKTINFFPNMGILKEDRPDFAWANQESRLFLSRGYLEEGKTVEQRVREICDHAERVNGIKGFADKLYHIVARGYLSFSSPVWNNFGNKRGLPISCFGSYIGDSVEDIVDTAAEVGMMSKLGGGTSAYFGDIRPRGSKITGNGESNGSFAFLELYQSVINTISQGSCYDDQTEILTNNGFKLFKDVDPTSDRLAMVDGFNNIVFTEDYELIINPYKGKMIKFSSIKNEESFDLLVTPNHRMVFQRETQFTFKGKRNRVWSMKETDIETAENISLHNGIRFFESGRLSSNTLEELSWLDKFRIAYQADGRKDAENRRIVFKFHKVRKVERLKEILDNLNLEYTVKKGYDKTTESNFYLFSIQQFPEGKKKYFKDWVKIDGKSNGWCIQFLNELKHWDGCDNKGFIRYSTTEKSNANFVHMIASLSGFGCNFNERDRSDENRSIIYNVNISEKNYRTGESIKKTLVDGYDGNVYCATVKTGRLLVRRNGKTLICGNSRRGAFAAYIDANHADLKEWLKIRFEGNPIQKLTWGVCISDDWWDEMLKGDNEKRDRWVKIQQCRAETGMPYILFTDNANRNKPEVYKDLNLNIKASNLCTEIMLPSSNDESFVCCLSSMNALYFDEWKNTDAVRIATIFLDTVMSEFIYKLEKSRKFQSKHMRRALKFAKRHRALGLGVLGYHSLLQSKMIPFDSFKAFAINHELFEHLHKESYEASRWMAKEFGKPELMEKYDRRNTTTLAIAPTKSSSFIFGNMSQGIEPIKANVYISDLAKVKTITKNPFLEQILESKGLNEEHIWKDINLHAGSIQHLGHIFSKEELEVFKTFEEISQMSIITQAGQRQKFIDQGQSINVVIHKNTPLAERHRLYATAKDVGVLSLYYQYSTNASQDFNRELLTCSSCEA